MCALFAATYPERTHGAGALGGVRQAAAERRLPVGADAGERGDSCEDRATAGAAPTWAIDCPRRAARRRAVRRLVRGYLRARREPGRRGGAHADEQRDRRPRRPPVDPRADARPAPRRRPRSSASRRRATWPSGSRARVRRAPGRRPPAVGRRQRSDRSTRSRSSSPACARGAEPDRVLATVLFTDIVGSTEQRGRARRPALARAARARTTRSSARELERFRGREVDTAGDGFLATFDGPARAIRCALRDPRRRARARDRGRAPALHTGECELVGRQGRRARGPHRRAGRRDRRRRRGPRLEHRQGSGRRAPGSSSSDRGEHELKGVPARGTCTRSRQRGRPERLAGERQLEPLDERGNALSASPRVRTLAASAPKSSGRLG